MTWLRNPWGKPRFLVVITGGYILWSLIPVAIAVMFAFNDGRSRTSWQGFSTRWFTAPTGSVFNDPALQGALKHTLFLGVMCVLVATPIGVALALGLQVAGARRGHRQHAHAASARHPRDRDGCRVVAALPPGAPRDRPRHECADHRPGDIHDLVRGRDRARSPRLDRERLRGGGGRPRRPPYDQLRRVLLPLLAPAIIASAAVVFAISLDDFVVTQYLSGDASTTTVSMLLYSSSRAAPTPALNALGTVALVITLLTLAFAYLVYKRFASSDVPPRWPTCKPTTKPPKRF